MIDKSARVVDTRPNPARVTIGGVGGGTGLVAIAQSIGPTTPLGVVLLYLSPLVAYVTGGLLYLAELQANRFLERRMVNSARKTLTRQLNDSAMSRDHRLRIRRKLEELEEAVAEAEIARVKMIGEVPKREAE